MKEEKNILNLYLSKVAQGDKSYLSKLARRLADRLLFIPVLSKSKGGSTTKINVYRHRKADQEVVPVFTTEKNLQSWSVAVAADFDSISILGADLCTALGDRNWVSIDEGCSHALTIEPELVIKIATTASEMENEPLPEPIYLAPENIIPPTQPAAEKVAETVEKPAVASRFQDWD